MVALPVPWPAFRERACGRGAGPSRATRRGRTAWRFRLGPVRATWSPFTGVAHAPECSLRFLILPESPRSAVWAGALGAPRADSRPGCVAVAPTHQRAYVAQTAAPRVSRLTSRVSPAGSLSAWRRTAMQPGGVSANDTQGPLLLGTTARYSCDSGGPSQMSFSVILTEKGGPTQRLDFECEEITIGRVDENDICLPKGNISKKHTRIVCKDGKIIVLDLKSTNGTYVNGRKLGGPQVISPADKVYIGDFILNVEPPDLELPQNGGAVDGTPVAEEPTMTPAILHSAAGKATRREPHLRPGTSTPAPQPCAPPASHGQTLQLVHGRLIEALDLRRLDLDALGSDELWQKAEASVRQIVSRMDQTGELGPHLDRDELIEDVLNEALGLGPLETWLADDSVSEIMVNSPTQV